MAGNDSLDSDGARLTKRAALGSLSDRLGAALGRRPLAQQLALLVLATALPILATTVFMFNRLVDDERLNIRQGLMVNAKTLANLVDTEIDTHAAIGTTLAVSASLQASDLGSFWAKAKAALEVVPGSWLALSTPDGQIILNTLAQPGTAFPKHAAPDVVRRGFETHQPQIGNLVFGPVAQKPTSFVEVPVFKGDVPIYSISIALPPDRMLGLIKGLFTHGEYVAIIDGNQRFVARLPDHAKWLGQLASEGWRAGLATSPEGWVDSKTVEGEPNLLAYTPTRRGWSVGVSQLESQISGPVEEIARSAALVTGAMLLLSALLAIAIAGRTSRGMAALTDTARKLGLGEVVRAPLAPFAEAAEIGATIASVSHELRHRGDLLAQHRDHLEAEVASRTSELTGEIERRTAVEDQFRQSQKMEALGQLTGGIAHDFNNMLAIVLGNHEMMQRRLARGDTDVLRFLDNATDGARRAATLTHRLLAFSRQQPLSPVVVNPNALITGMAELLRRSIGADVRLEMVHAGGLWRICVDPGQLEQAIINLAINGRDAMENGGRLTVETFNAVLDDAYAADHPGVGGGQYVAIAISDDGAGMTAEVASRAFDPFFTTKPVHKGTGLGLSQVFGFVKQSGGHAKIYSEPGHGTTVKLYFPRTTEPEAKEASAPVGAQPLPSGSPSESILVVEDEEKVRRMVVEALRDLGYTVAHADRGEDGVEIAERIPDLKLLLTDVVMPGMNGRELADQVKTKRPGIKVLYMTGYTRNAVIHDGKLDANVNFLAKPFALAQLAAKVRSVLDDAQD